MTEVTVVMSVFNSQLYLKEAADSIFAQSLRDFRFVIVDDGSTDGSGRVLDQYADERLEVFHRTNRGLGASLNEALSLCRTEYVARMDSDDLCMPRRLEHQLAFLRSHPSVGLVGTKIAYIDRDGRLGSSPPMPCRHEEIRSDLLRKRHAVTHASVMMRRSLVTAVGGYRIPGVGQDLDLFLRISEVAELANLDEIGMLIRFHGESVTTKSHAEVNASYGYAIHCSRRRQDKLPEPTFEDFLTEWRRRFWVRRAAEWLDGYSLRQYRKSMGAAVGKRRMRGYVRLAFAALCSPPRTYQRVTRFLRRDDSAPFEIRAHEGVHSDVPAVATLSRGKRSEPGNRA